MNGRCRASNSRHSPRRRVAGPVHRSIHGRRIVHSGTQSAEQYDLRPVTKSLKRPEASRHGMSLPRSIRPASPPTSSATTPCASQSETKWLVTLVASSKTVRSPPAGVLLRKNVRPSPSQQYKVLEEHRSSASVRLAGRPRLTSTTRPPSGPQPVTPSRTPGGAPQTSTEAYRSLIEPRRHESVSQQSTIELK